MYSNSIHIAPHYTERKQQAPPFFFRQRPKPQVPPTPFNRSHHKQVTHNRFKRVCPSPNNKSLPKRVVKKPRCDQISRQLPPYWWNCPAYGQSIDNIVPSKVPLGESYDDLVDPYKRYHLPKEITQGTSVKKIGLVVDLTSKSGYYQPLEGVKHLKIQCKGKDSIPDNESVNHFVYEVFQFLANQYKDLERPKKYILVHSTHGYNRTGYMIVHYIVRAQAISVTEALQVFAKARPPGIFRNKYIDALYTFYHETRPETVVCPPSPEWKSCPYPLDLNAEPMADNNQVENGDDKNNGTLVPQSEGNHLMSIDDVLGDTITEDYQFRLQGICYRLLKLEPMAKENPKFPGAYPITLSKTSLKLLRERYFYATWKAVGTRYMMLITWEGCYLIDKKFHFRRVQMRFPLKQTNAGHLKEFHNFTLLDGEMVIDALPDTQNQERRYLVSDVMAINNVSVFHLPFQERWKMVEKQVIEPRNLEKQFIHQSGNKNYRYDMEPFRVRRKDFWMLSGAQKILNGFIPKLSHAADGLIFQGRDDPYVPKNHEGLLQWKYTHNVDFLFEVDKQGHRQLFLLDRGEKKLMIRHQVVFQTKSDPSEFSGKIIECSLLDDNQTNVWNVCLWKFERVRSDKVIPSSTTTLRKARSVESKITENTLMNEVAEIIHLPIYTERLEKNRKSPDSQSEALKVA
ncbi:hypothetical protein IFM89_031921 [Coptis chinensis]|uniref:mRNA guanylyltransferase n=1 Tax=Coptis chinensis TaxID=261450 RepID=A0A835IUI0_9MAGN|nr:hypothetical protein IFM89_031921 [Coptis chinensis]